MINLAHSIISGNNQEDADKGQDSVLRRASTVKAEIEGVDHLASRGAQLIVGADRIPDRFSRS